MAACPRRARAFSVPTAVRRASNSVSTREMKNEATESDGGKVVTVAAACSRPDR